MLFTISPANRAARIAAGFVLLAMSLGLAVIPLFVAREAAIVVFALSLAIICVNLYQAVDIWLRRRRDPYDLSKLWETPVPEETPDPEPDPGGPHDDDLLYCHRCGAAMSGQFAVCPGCGHRLGY